jgi:gliding motility-associated protein GldM
MSVPKEPRQLMINLMYLVLTAMLALNVSSEILHAFKIINQSITQSNTSINSKNNELHLAFDANEARPEAHDRVKEYNDKAKQISKEADLLYSYLENWKERVIEESGGYKIDNGEKEIKAESNIDASTVLLVEKKGGDSLKQKLADFKKMAVSVLFPEIQKQFEEQLPIRINNPKKSESNPQADWSYGNFHSMPVMAVVTLMSKFQNDVRNTESLIINELFKEADAKQMKFDWFIYLDADEFIIFNNKLKGVKDFLNKYTFGKATV